jgi:hypothetical protein
MYKYPASEVIITFTPGAYKQNTNCREAYLLGSTASYNVVTIKSCNIIIII